MHVRSGCMTLPKRLYVILVLQGLPFHPARAAPPPHCSLDLLQEENDHSARSLYRGDTGLHTTGWRGARAAHPPRSQRWRCCHAPDWRRTSDRRMARFGCRRSNSAMRPAEASRRSVAHVVCHSPHRSRKQPQCCQARG